jgi:hypothetical protein
VTCTSVSLVLRVIVAERMGIAPLWAERSRHKP